MERAGEKLNTKLGINSNGEKPNILNCKTEQIGEIVSSLHALITGAAIDVNEVAGIKTKKLEVLAEQMKSAKYGVIIWSPADLDIPGLRAVELGDLNVHGRAGSHDLKRVGARAGVSGTAPDAGYGHRGPRQSREEGVIRGRGGATAGFLAANVSGSTSERISSGQGEVRSIATRLITIVGGGSEPSVITDGETHRAATVSVVIDPELILPVGNPRDFDRGSVVEIVEIPLHHRGITTTAVSAIGGPVVGH